jgi:hypothetical protein
MSVSVAPIAEVDEDGTAVGCCGCSLDAGLELEVVLSRAAAFLMSSPLLPLFFASLLALLFWIQSGKVGRCKVTKRWM